MTAFRMRSSLELLSVMIVQEPVSQRLSGAEQKNGRKDWSCNVVTAYTHAFYLHHPVAQLLRSFTSLLDKGPVAERQGIAFLEQIGGF